MMISKVNRIMKINNSKKAVLVAAVVLLLGPLGVLNTFGAASKSANYCFMAKKLAPEQEYTECQTNPSDMKTIKLSLGEKARFAMRIGIAEEVIDELKYRVIFPLDKNPISITASVQPDALPQQPLMMNLDLPDNTYLAYIPNTTVYETYLGDGQYSDMEIPDANGVSSLYANAGSWYTISKVGDPDKWVWTFMYFDMEVVAGEDGPPNVPNPALELKMTVDSDKTEAKIASGDKITVKVWLHNAQIDSLATGVKLAVVLSGSASGRAFTASSKVTADNHEALSSGSVKITSVTDAALSYVEGSAKLFNYGDTEGTKLTDTQVLALFSDGLTMGDEGKVIGCWIYQQWVEFDLAAASILGAEEMPKVLAATGPEHVAATALYLAYLGFLLRKLKLTKFF